MAAGTNWDGAIANVSDYNLSDAHVGSQYVTADGAFNTDTIASKQQIMLKWEMLTQAQRNTIFAKVVANTSGTLTINGVSFGGGGNFLPVRGSWSENTVPGAGGYVNCSVVLRQA